MDSSKRRKKKKKIQDLIKRAFSRHDPLSPFDSFRVIRKITYLSAWNLALLKKNTEGFYGSDWPLQAKVKRKEMSSTDVRYIFVRELRCGDAYEASTQKDLRGRV
ncbi:BnaC02g42470D [Brassica napus]|uniref:BnaC02g42470D protein n=1 Tax=Brassica napus TaxID=3708 RepID=A0A078I4F7_BRANA|nr:BnaC02g42470D [Brassica napus]